TTLLSAYLRKTLEEKLNLKNQMIRIRVIRSGLISDRSFVSLMHMTVKKLVDLVLFLDVLAHPSVASPLGFGKGCFHNREMADKNPDEIIVRQLVKVLKYLISRPLIHVTMGIPSEIGRKKLSVVTMWRIRIPKCMPHKGKASPIRVSINAILIQEVDIMLLECLNDLSIVIVEGKLRRVSIVSK